MSGVNPMQAAYDKGPDFCEAMSGTSRMTGHTDYHLDQISDDIHTGAQSVERIFVGRVKKTAVAGAQEFKVRVHIKSDSYADQSFAVLSVWNAADLKWSRVANIPYSRMNTPIKLIYMSVNRHHRREFQRDFDRLMSEAVQILF